MLGKIDQGAVVVVGGTGGLGVEICQRFSGLGAAVSFSYRSDEAGAVALLERLQSCGGRAQMQQTDLLDVSSLAKLFARTEGAFGSVGTVVFASGAKVQLAPLAEMSAEAWQRCLNADAIGFFNLVQAAIPSLRKSRGSIVALSTAATQRYAPLDILSAGPKASVEQLVKAVAREEGRHGIRANGVRVGQIDAGQGLSIQEDPRGKRLAERIAQATPLQRLGTATDVADVVLFLASSMASYVTGEFICVDGGGHL